MTITKPFWLGKTVVTQSQWKAVMGNNPSHFKGDDLPVEQVSWHDAVAFCEKLNAMKRDTVPDGYHYTLPTEAQWEYACRAGTTTRFYYGDDPDYGQLEKYAWDGYNSSDKTHPVGEKLPNEWGLYDMHGNVFEWCLDGYDDYTGESVSDPQGPHKVTDGVYRGGSWYYNASYCRSALRDGDWPGCKRHDLGFRVALSCDPDQVSHTLWLSSEYKQKFEELAAASGFTKSALLRHWINAEYTKQSERGGLKLSQQPFPELSESLRGKKRSRKKVRGKRRGRKK